MFPQEWMEPFCEHAVDAAKRKGAWEMNSIVWLVGAVVIVIAVLNLIGIA